MGRGDTQEEREVEKWSMKEILLSFLASMLTTACAHTLLCREISSSQAFPDGVAMKFQEVRLCQYFLFRKNGVL